MGPGESEDDGGGPVDDRHEWDGGGGTVRSSERTAGDYSLVRSLGRGGFGEVFLGEAPDGRLAAVKVLHATWANDPDMRRRFTTEVEQARRVSGFCIAAIVDADPGAAEPWIATEYIDGPTLQAAVAQDGPSSGVELHRLAVSTATALAAIHAAGVVHRDLKPDNIMLAPDGPRVIDFGIARAVEATSVTASGIVGTVGYMAPEQLEGMRLTPAVDIFSWGAVMVYAATGNEAFPGPTQASRIARILGGEPDLGSLAEPLAGIVRTCLDKDPGRRPDATTLLNLLVTMPADGSPAPLAAPTGPPVPDPELHARTPPSPGAPLYSPPPAPGPLGAPPVPPPHHRGVPPYHFHGVRFTDPGDLAAAMQQNWSAAVHVFSDAVERSTLGAWIMDDLGDTRVDRSLFRGRAGNDANLAVAAFISQLRPDLPPIFRGRGATVAELSEMYNDPRPLLAGAPMANELVLLARPGVLRTMGAHHGQDTARLLQLADQLDEAERAAHAFHRQLTTELEGWRTARFSVSAALILAFLLHPERLVPPADGGDAGVGEWVSILWERVRGEPTPANAGCAAVVYGALPKTRELAEQRRHWEHQHDRARANHDDLRSEITLQERLVRALRLCRFSVLCLPAALVVYVAAGGGAMTTVAQFLLSLGLLGVTGALVMEITVRVLSGGVFRRNRRYRELSDVANQLPHLVTGVSRIQGDLRRAREICGHAAVGRTRALRGS